MTPPLSRMKVTCPFGWRKHPINGKSQFHNGIDLKASVGDPIVAPFSGVFSTSHHPAGGLQAFVTHDGLLVAGFAHLSRIADGLKNGDPVNEGQVIGFAGRSGKVTGPHVHYTLGLVEDGVKRVFNPEVVIYTS